MPAKQEKNKKRFTIKAIKSLAGIGKAQKVSMRP